MLNYKLLEKNRSFDILKVPEPLMQDLHGIQVSFLQILLVIKRGISSMTIFLVSCCLQVYNGSLIKI